MKNKILFCPICHNQSLKLKFKYTSKPDVEMNFKIDKSNYYREYYECIECGHMYGKVDYDFSKFYNGEYTEITYGQGIQKTFDRLINLPKGSSDNEKRFKFISNFLDSFFLDKKAIEILDVGSGLGVFPWLVNKSNLKITALDPDKKNIEHIKKNVGVKTYNKDFFDLKTKKKFDIITFNKVIEHIINPEAMLKKSLNFLKKKSFLYVEVPDAKASQDGKNREEFTIEHFHVFSKNSLKILCKKLDLKCLKIESVIEPSGKYTIRSIFSFT